MATEILTAERVRYLLSYDAETGIFTRKVNVWRGKAGDTVGWPNSNGYPIITIDQKKYRLHRLAWLYVTGEWPTGEVDHVNGCRTDNRWANLRDVSRLVNQQNLRAARSGNKSGLLGVSSNGSISKPFVAKIRIDGRQISVGSFETPELAHEAYLRAKRAMHVGCTI